MTGDMERSPPEGRSPSSSGDISELLGRLIRGVAFNHVFSKLLGIAVQAEGAVSEVIAIHLGRNQECMEILAEEVFGHVPNDKKLKILEHLVTSQGCLVN